ncbi:thiamine phosphate synthase [Alteromonas hispanica]|uniref:Thiamine-phosphate synthase n=1 Tax=Alteromonas hispanica TaxID=315421 RepID=A0A6L9MXX1_9ALTE|nr:thiamine phosphate synthase [Alteromonas hispanica]NDW23008.1 thiamine phosphate synthase [Alteromonas hispanica]
MTESTLFNSTSNSPLHAPTVWCVGGTDSSGGAGVTRDLATLCDLGVRGCVIVTQVTAQSNSKMLAQAPMAPSVINEQWQALASEGLPHCIKIGAVANDEQAFSLCARIELLAGPRPFIIWDPVLQTSSMSTISRLSKEAIVQLLNVADIVTPNVSELAALSQYFRNQSTISSHHDARKAAKTLLATSNLAEHPGAEKATLLKGVFVKAGHADWQCDATDMYFTQTEDVSFSQPRCDAGELRGTGCLLASAIAGFYAKDYCVNDALTLANAYVRKVRNVSTSQRDKFHHPKAVGFPTNPDIFPTVCFKNSVFKTSANGEREISHQHSSPFEPFEPFVPIAPKRGIYPVVDSADWIERLLPTGVNIIQLRIKSDKKDSGQAWISEEIKKAVALTRGTSCQLFINDHWELAIEHGAFGVHLGQEDLFDADIKAIRHAGLRLGVSTHGYAELQRVKALSPSYIALGHIFATQTKTMPSKPQGLARLKQYVQLCADTPTVAIGGIDISRCKAVANTGVTHIAVVSAITKATNPIHAYSALNKEAGYA